MSKRKRIQDFGVRIGRLPRGRLNKITDVAGVRVGHSTIDTNEHKTGVTVVLPQEDSGLRHELVAAAYVLNGFGKTLGLVQIEELGTLETPIALTTTLNVGLVHDALVEYAIQASRKQGRPIKTVNPVVCECNDGYLSNIQKRAVRKKHVFEAIRSGSVDFEEGDVGAGKGVSCHQLKGGIGSASRVIALDAHDYTLGVLVQSNHGLLRDLIVDGKTLGRKLVRKIKLEEEADKGSIIIVIATDIPCTSRQLKRICKRASVGLARVGSYVGHGSGEIMIAFSTANSTHPDETKDILSFRMIREDRLDKAFRAVAEATEEAILNSMVAANRVIGISGHVRESLKDYLITPAAHP